MWNPSVFTEESGVGKLVKTEVGTKPRRANLLYGTFSAWATELKGMGSQFSKYCWRRQRLALSPLFFSSCCGIIIILPPKFPVHSAFSHLLLKNTPITTVSFYISEQFLAQIFAENGTSCVGGQTEWIQRRNEWLLLHRARGETIVQRWSE